MKVNVLRYVLMFLLAAAGTVCADVFAQTENDTPATGATNGRYYYGYCSYDEPKSEYGLGYDSDAMMQWFARMPRSKMRVYEGGQVIGVRIAATEELPVDAILKDRINGEVFCRKSADLVPGWNEVLFDEPYDIIDAEVCFGYECQGVPDTSGSYFPVPGVICVTDGAEDASQDALYWMTLDSSPQSLAADYGNLMVQLIITGVPELTENQAEFAGIVMPKMKEADGTSSVELKVRNLGSNVFNKIEIGYTVGDAAEEVLTVSEDLNVQAVKTIRLEKLPAEKGDEFSARIISVNDERVTGAEEISAVFDIAEKSFTRRVLMEHFTTEDCGNCPRADKFMHEIIERDYADLVVWASHHAGYGTDEYTLPESKELLFMYGPDGTYAPAIMLDRRVSEQFKSQYPYPVHNVPSVESEMKALLDEALSYPAPLSVEIGESYNAETRVLDVTVSGEISLQDIDLGNAYLNVWILEDSIKADYQAGTGWKDEAAQIPNDWWHEHLIRKMATGFSGEALVADGDTYSHEFSIYLEQGWHPGRCTIVAFVSRDINGNGMDAYVYNANKKTLEHYGAVASETAERNVPVAYADGGMIKVSAEAGLTVYAVNGMAVENNALASGIYIVRIECAAGVFVQKVAVP